MATRLANGGSSTVTALSRFGSADPSAGLLLVKENQV